MIKIESFPTFLKWYRESWVYRFVHPLMLTESYITFKIKTFIQYAESIPRSFGFEDSRFLKLKSFHNKYKGKRCFITCTGPSLTISDLEMLKDEYVFGMNSIALIHDRTDWKPDFYAIQDTNVYENLKDAIHSTDNGVIFAPYSYLRQYNTPSNWVYWHMCGSYHLFEMIYLHKYFTKFSNNVYARVYDGYSIAISIMQIVMYMGFDEIYLLGADCSYLGKQQHFVETGVYEPDNNDMTQKLITSYTTVKQNAEKIGVKIYNATRGGYLELFPRVNLENVISDSKKNKIHQ